MHEIQLLFARKGDVGFNPTRVRASKGDGGFNPTHRRASKGDRGFTRELSDAGGRRQSQSQTKVARNLTRSVLKNVSKRCNSNDVNSTFEILEGELRATLMRRDGSWPGTESTRRATHQRPGTTGVEGAGGPDGARNTSEAASNKLNRKFRLRRPVWRVPEGPEGRKRAWLRRPRGRWRGLAGLFTATQRRWCGGRRRDRRTQEGMAAVPVGGGRAQAKHKSHVI